MTGPTKRYETALAGMDTASAISGAIDDAAFDRAIDPALVDTITSALFLAVEEHADIARSWAWETTRGNLDGIPATSEAGTTVATITLRALLTPIARALVLASA
jgi:hypothetical protein